MDTPNNGLNNKQEGIMDGFLSLFGISKKPAPVKKVAQPPQTTPQAPKPEETPKPYVTPTHPGTGRWLRSRLR